jgi:hypothetical protein
MVVAYARIDKTGKTLSFLGNPLLNFNPFVVWDRGALTRFAFPRSCTGLPDEDAAATASSWMLILGYHISETQRRSRLESKRMA